MLPYSYRATTKIVAAMMFAGLICSAHAQHRSMANNEIVGQFIVKLKPGMLKSTDNLQRNALSESKSNNPVTRLQTVIDRVLTARSARTNRFFNQSASTDSNFDIAENIQPKNTINSNTMVLSLKNPISVVEAEQLMADFAADSAVAYIEPDVRVHHFLIPDDTRYKDQWGYFDSVGGANLPAAWEHTTGSPDVIVAVVDTGYVAHGDLQENLLLPGYDFISNPSIANGAGLGSDGRDPGDWITEEENEDANGMFYQCGAGGSSWHGTHVAGTIGAVTNNGLGVSGVAWNSRILPVRVLGKCGGYLSDVIAGMRWAAGLPISNVPTNQNPAKILNLSLGSYAKKCSQAFTDAVLAIRSKGASIVVAAGNSGGPVAESQPANCTGVISVGANDKYGDRPYFGNYGTTAKPITISAPGVNILSTVDAGQQSPIKDSYASFNGTSMAAPHVAGTIALMLSINPELTSDQITQKLKITARKFPTGSRCTTTKCGSGILDAGKVVNWVTAGK